jgi:ABC-2 type transport system ATP-binding protein
VHALLADVPSEIRIRCGDAPQLARRLLETDAVQSLRLMDDGRSLVVATRSAATIYRRLPEWIAGTDIRIEEFRSTDDSLQALFASLLRIHRGRS